MPSLDLELPRFFPMYLKHGEEGKEDRVGAEERGEEKNDVELELERREGEDRMREGRILGNRIDLGKLPVLLFFEG